VQELWDSIKALPWHEEGEWQFQNMRKFLHDFEIFSKRESDSDSEGNGTQHVPVVKRLSWAVTILEAQLDLNTPWLQRNCSRELMLKAVLD